MVIMVATGDKPIRFYDMEIEAFREPTQADWDAVFAAACRKHKEICELQAVLRDHGIPLPPGHKDRAGEL